MEWTPLDPLVVWGLFQRGLGLVHLISFLSLSPQLLPYAGERGALQSRPARARRARSPLRAKAEATELLRA